MDQIAQWRPAEPAGPEGQPDQKQPTNADDGRSRILVAGAVGAIVLAAAGAMLWATTPQPQIVLQPLGRAGGQPLDAIASNEPLAAAAQVTEVMVDVQGAVERPGLHRLPPGSRVGDAIAIAGGYSLQVDVAAAAQRLNLAQRLQDGDKVHVPARGENALALPGAVASPETDPTNPSSGGLIDLNTATEAQLDTLPGIGPVTAGKIIAAREEAPFGSVDELLGRGVVGPATYEKVRQLVTVGR